MVIASHFELLVEEPSAEAFFQTLLPRILPSTCTFTLHPFQGKDDLLSKLEARLKGYAAWLPADWRIVVALDRDDDDCIGLKQRMEAMAQRAGLRTRTRAGGPDWQVVNRVTVEELEAWYFGDWAAVRSAFPRVSAHVPQRQGLRDPDAIRGGTWETFERQMQRAGYFKGGLRKMEAARAIAAQFRPEQNTSRSFQVLHAALIEVI